MTQVLLLDESGAVCGRCEKQKAHIDGLYHLAYSVIIKNSRGEMLLQRRAKEKYHSGGKWSNACCSHPDSDDIGGIIAHAKRRLREEMGFSCELEKITEFSYKAQVGELVENEHDVVLSGVYDGDIRPDPSEVCDYRYIPEDELRQWIAQNPDDFSPWFLKIVQILGI